MQAQRDGAVREIEDLGVHTPLPKRGPHLGKRPPLARPPDARPPEPSVSRAGAGRQLARGSGRRHAAGAGCSPGAATRERATTPEEGASATGPRSSTQSPHHAKTRQNRTDRASTDARPRLQPPVPTPDSSPALSPPPSASPRWSTHRSQIRHQSTHHTRPCPVAAAPPPAHQHPPGLTRPTFTWQVEEGGSGAKRRTPLPRKPRREAETAGGGAAACCAQGRNP